MAFFLKIFLLFAWNPLMHAGPFEVGPFSLMTVFATV